MLGFLVEAQRIYSSKSFGGSRLGVACRHLDSVRVNLWALLKPHRVFNLEP